MQNVRRFIDDMFYTAILGSMLYELLYNRLPGGLGVHGWMQVCIVAIYVLDWFYVSCPALKPREHETMSPLQMGATWSNFGAILLFLAAFALARPEWDQPGDEPILRRAYSLFCIAGLACGYGFFQWRLSKRRKRPLAKSGVILAVIAAILLVVCGALILTGFLPTLVDVWSLGPLLAVFFLYARLVVLAYRLPLNAGA